ncbi:ABC transporter ATP-binding protein [Pelagibacterium limicola]|uniref:ABC transporter ATP-binding protein n=1 Tax=Pelagibacterium limicola TaxID=2791022 RepID=UPI0018B00478|nr:ABC transporter ATP-binding protein [Pelagibacterium limicola]
MIEVENLGFTYVAAASPALAGLSFSVKPGSVYGLLGPSGAGKSTTQKILMGLLAGYSGVARVFGTSPGAGGRGFYQRIGVGFELPALFLRLTARENLALFAALYQSAPLTPMEALAAVDLADAADMRVEAFSKGMKMRLNLCRALLNDPELLFLDEPTSGQDPARARQTRQLIAGLRELGKTVFLTTHNMGEAAEICDQVGFLVGGKIAVEGKPFDLMRQYGQRQVEVVIDVRGKTAKQTFPIEGVGTNPQFLELIASPHLVSIRTLEATLDDVFIAVAGAKQ